MRMLSYMSPDRPIYSPFDPCSSSEQGHEPCTFFAGEILSVLRQDEICQSHAPQRAHG